MWFIWLFLSLLLLTILYFVYQIFFRSIPILGEDHFLREKISCFRNPNGRYEIRIGIPNSKPPYTLQILANFQETEASSPPKKVFAQEFSLSPNPRQRRHFFNIQNNQNELFQCSERRIPLKYTSNFRDLGGYTNQEGKSIPWGRLYRADKVVKVHPGDYTYFQSLGIKFFCDFRGPEETQSRPHKLPESLDIEVINLPIFDPSRSIRDLLKKLRKSKPGDFSGSDYMKEGYAKFPIRFKECYQQFFQILLKEKQPILFHCTGGKDRTGLASALLLHILGMSRDFIYQDYLASNYFRKEENKRQIRLGAVYGIHPEISTPILEVRKEYLEEAFLHIDQDFGSLENYLERALGLGKEEQDLLREKYLI